MALQFHAFAMMASKYGNVDPLDIDGVEHFFSHVEDTLSEQQIHALVDELGAFEGQPLPAQFVEPIRQHARLHAQDRRTEMPHLPSKADMPRYSAADVARKAIEQEQLVEQALSANGMPDLDSLFKVALNDAVSDDALKKSAEQVSMLAAGIRHLVTHR